MAQAMKIAIVDDEKDMRTYLEAVFRKAGYETESAEDGDQGVWLAEAKQPDLITLDLEMPDEWGPRFYRKLRKEKALRDIPVIVVSGIDGDHAIQSAVAFVKKPFDPEKLVGIVKNTSG